MVTDRRGAWARRRTALVVVVAGALVGAGVGMGVGPDDPKAPDRAVWMASGERATKGCVVVGVAVPPGLAAVASAPEMVRRARGVVGTLDVRALTALQRATMARPSYTPGDRSPAQVWTVGLEGAAGRPAALVRVERWTDGVLTVARAAGGGVEGDRLRVKPEVLTTVEGWGDAPVGGAPPADRALGRLAKLERPYAPGWVAFDQATIERRMEGGRPTAVPGSARDLDRETLWARLPVGVAPRARPGLLVWIDAGPEPSLPPDYGPVLDALNLVLVAPGNCGNERVVSERFQLAMDAVATARWRWPIDERRVYVAGISGGGKMASMLAICFPEVFTGCVPVVGLSGYKPVQIGAGQLAPQIARPEARLMNVLRRRRIAPMTGPRDFNHDEIVIVTQALTADGLQIRVIDVPLMGHQMPPIDRFEEALKWVDEPAQAAMAAEATAAQRALAETTGRFGDGPPKSPGHRKALEGVLAAGPWTPAAWTALDRLSAGEDKAVAPAKPPAPASSPASR